MVPTAMTAIEVATLDGPDGLRLVERPLPLPADGEALIEVRASGVAFPDLLLSRGVYQVRPEPPFVPGLEVAGTVVSAPAGSELRAGERVAAFTSLGGMAGYATAPVEQVFALPDALDGHVRPLVGTRLPLARAADALRLLERRAAIGKVVLEH
jgi:NADPH2:quinone reductase